MLSPEDYRWMAHALRLAEQGLYTTDPNPRVGCVLVKDGLLLAEGWHRRAGGDHAEVDALKQLGRLPVDVTAYVTLEPCSHFGKTPPCAVALIEAGIARVVIAMQDPNPLVAGKGIQRLRAAGIEVECGLLEQQAEALNRGVCQRMRVGRPWLSSKIAASLDGRTAMRSGHSQWITSPAARADVHRLRARASAMLTGSQTVIDDNPALTARLESKAEILQALRIVLDSELSTAPDSQVYSGDGNALIVTCCDDINRHQPYLDLGVQLVVLDAQQDGRVDLQQLMPVLARLEINEVMVECGAVLNGALLRAGLVNEWLVYQAPIVLGHEGRAMFDLPGLDRVEQGSRMVLAEVRYLGNDLRLQLLPAQASA